MADRQYIDNDVYVTIINKEQIMNWKVVRWTIERVGEWIALSK